MASAAPNIFEPGAAPQQGGRATETTYRKIELQSPADLTYIVANVTQAAREKIGAQLAATSTTTSTTAGQDTAEDAERELRLRKRVEELVDEYIRDTFSAAKDSIAINGMDSKELEAELSKIQEGEELEPFDSKLAQRIQALSAQIEAQTLQMASLRRKGPQQTARRFVRAFEEDTQAYEGRLQADQDNRLQAARATNITLGGIGEGSAKTEDDAAMAARWEDVGGTYRRGVETLGKLQAGMGGTVAKMERAQRATEVAAEKDSLSSK